MVKGIERRYVVHALFVIYVCFVGATLLLWEFLSSPGLAEWLTSPVTVLQRLYFTGLVILGHIFLYVSFNYGGLCKGTILHYIIFQVKLSFCLWYGFDGTLIIVSLFIANVNMLPMIVHAWKIISNQGERRLSSRSSQEDEGASGHSKRHRNHHNDAGSGDNHDSDHSIHSDTNISHGAHHSDSISRSDSSATLDHHHNASNATDKPKSQRSGRLGIERETQVLARLRRQRLWSTRVCEGIISASDSDGSVYITHNARGALTRVALDAQAGCSFILTRVMLVYFTAHVVCSYAVLTSTHVCSALHLVCTALGVIEACHGEKTPKVFTFFRIH